MHGRELVDVVPVPLLSPGTETAGGRPDGTTGGIPAIKFGGIGGGIPAKPTGCC